MLIRILKLLSLVILSVLLASGCSQKEIVFKDKFICHNQSSFEKPSIDIYVAEEDEQNLIDFLDANDSAHSKYKEQVNRNNKRCERLEDEK